MLSDRKTKMSGTVKLWECVDCGEFKSESSFHTSRSSQGRPAAYCKPCSAIRSRDHHRRHRAEKRARAEAAAKAPVPVGCKISPEKVAAGVGLKCPDCGGTAVRERANGRAGFDTWHVTCAYCSELDQLVEVAPDGTAQTVVRSPISASPKKKGRKKSAPADEGGSAARFTEGVGFRPVCKVGHCKERAEEYGLCGLHLSACRVAGRLGGVDRWVAEQLPPKKRPPAVRSRKVARPVKVTAGVCNVIDCKRAADHKDNRLCKPCYEYWRRHGRPDLEGFLVEPTSARRKGYKKRSAKELAAVGVCAVRGCATRPYHQTAVCRLHHQRWTASGRPDLEGWVAAGGLRPKDWARRQSAPEALPDDIAELVCHVDRCFRAASCRAGTLCNACYQRWNWNRRPDFEFFKTIVPPKSQRQEVRHCVVPACSGVVFGPHGLCSTHKQRWSLVGRPDLDEWIRLGALTPVRWRELLAEHAAELAGEAKCS